MVSCVGHPGGVGTLPRAEDLRSWLWLIPLENTAALAGVTQRTEHRPENHRVAGSIPSQDTCLDSEPGPQ